LAPIAPKRSSPFSTPLASFPPAQLRAIIEEQIETLLRCGELIETDGRPTRPGERLLAAYLSLRACRSGMTERGNLAKSAELVPKVGFGSV
jgi:hypothetical protein